jgi:hypothetical protein
MSIIIFIIFDNDQQLLLLLLLLLLLFPSCWGREKGRRGDKFRKIVYPLERYKLLLGGLAPLSTPKVSS